MRKIRTAHSSIFEVFAEHETGPTLVYTTEERED